MAQDLTHWLGKMGCQIDTGSAEEAVREFGQRLSRMAVTEDFRLDRNLFEQVVCRHTGSTLTLTEALQELEDEACVAGKLLTEEARKFGYGGDWESCYRNIEEEPLGPDDRKGLLRLEIDRLREHCIRQGFLSGQVPTPDGIDIEFLPPSLASIRAADSYNARPGYPFQGGVFYIFKSSSLGASIGSIHPSYRMTAAHETYPGHHLLDFFRWNNPEPVLRSTEYPLFYEGWACFGEDLMFHTGAFERAYDRLILLRRRFRHALRGKVDLMVHSGKMGIEDAAGKLALGGFSGSRALDMARKYALRPAYQMCYTIGRRQFQKLFESYGQRDIPEFVNTVLSSGELLFKDLEKVLQQTMRHGDTETLRHGESID
jgi:uncharacterized protein (DUF885 family)